jgi:hypothetical protein
MRVSSHAPRRSGDTPYLRQIRSISARRAT